MPFSVWPLQFSSAEYKAMSAYIIKAKIIFAVPGKQWIINK